MTVNVHDEVFALCRGLGLEPERVRRLVLEPTSATAEYLKVNEGGAKYIDPETGEVAYEELAFEIATFPPVREDA